MQKSVLFFLYLFFLIQGSLFATPNLMPQEEYLNKTEISPKKLTYFRDSIQFEVSGEIPVISVLLPRNPKLRLVLRNSDRVMDLGRLELDKIREVYSFNRSWKIQYEDWFDDAILELQFFQGKKESLEPFETKIIARGVDTTPLMAKVGKVLPNEPIPEIGIFIPSGLASVDRKETRVFTFLYNAGDASFAEGFGSNSSELQRLREFLITHSKVSSFKITGIQSPERQEGRNSKLGQDRAKSLSKFIRQNQILLDTTKVSVGSRWNDWFDFRLLLREYTGLSTQDKDGFYEVLLNGDPYESQREALTKLDGYKKTSADLFPFLRAAKVEIEASPVEGLDQSSSQKLVEELRTGKMNSDLSFEEWALAAETSPRLSDQNDILIKMTELFRSALPYNNLAVVKMREAQRALDETERDSLLDKAVALLGQAERIETGPYLLHNLAQIMILKGEDWEAYKKLSDASVLTRDQNFLRKNESLRGALDILRGDYKLATLRFDYSFNEPGDFFNKGLAYFMAKDYANATVFFEESVLADRNYGYGYYGLALVAASAKMEDIALLQLGKAIEVNELLYQKALIDPTFETLRDSQEFFDLFRQTNQ